MTSCRHQRLRLMSAAVLWVVAGCVHLPATVRAELQCVPERPNLYGGARACTAAEHAAAAQPQRERPAEVRDLPLASGQIILIERPVPMSLYLSLMAERFAPYIHAGIVVIDEGTPYVYEAFGSFGIRVTGSPADDMHGGIRRVPLKSFLRRDGFIAVFEPPPEVDRERLVQFARDHLARKTPFDGYFDNADASRFYCVEFVARALESSGGPLVPGARVTPNRSASSVLGWLKTVGPDLLLAGDLVDAQRPIWFSSRRYTREQMAAYFGLKKELHRRFTAQQPLGSLFRWGWQNLEYRPLVQAYFDAGMRPGAPDAQTLARLMFDGAQGPAQYSSR